MAEKFDKYEKALSGKREIKGEPIQGGDVKAAGSVKIVGGKYNVVSVSGAFKCEGDLEANVIKIAGSAKIVGSLKAPIIRVSGSLSVDGKIVGDKISVSGAAKVRESIKGSEVKISGGVSAHSIEGDLLKIAGGIKCKTLSGKQIYLSVGNETEVDYIKGDIVEIKGGESRILSFFGIFKLSRVKKPVLKVNDRVEARLLKLTNIILEGSVDAERIELYRGSEIKGKINGKIVKID